VETPDGPKHFVGGKLADELVPLLCERCARNGRRIELGRAVIWDGNVHFQRVMNTRRSRVVLGTPVFHLTADGRKTTHRSWVFLDSTTGQEFECPECKAHPVANGVELARVVVEAIARSTERGWGLPVLIDPFGGATVAGG